MKKNIFHFQIKTLIQDMRHQGLVWSGTQKKKEKNIKKINNFRYSIPLERIINVH